MSGRGYVSTNTPTRQEPQGFLRALHEGEKLKAGWVNESDFEKVSELD